MRAIICLVLITAAAHGLESVTGNGDYWTTIDKRQHAAAGAIIGGVGYALADTFAPKAKTSTKILIGIGAAVLIGTAKEVYDSRHPDDHDASCKDALATYGGGVVGALSVGWAFHF